ncbi:ABC transporter substrate-binding protein, partial [Magnetococcales bacterium HHB-1]
GLYKAAKFYYYPGWHEPGTTLESLINKAAYEKLPEDLQVIVMNACKVANLDMLSDFTARNNQALNTLIRKHKVALRRFPDGVLKKIRGLSDQVVAEIAEKDPFSKKVYQSFIAFREQAISWHKVSELAYMQSRIL